MKGNEDKRYLYDYLVKPDKTIGEYMKDLFQI